MDAGAREELTRIVSAAVQWDCPLSGYTSFAIGGPAEALVTAGDSSELAGLLELFARRRLAWRIIGRGTNLLVRDEGFAGVVVLLGDGFQQLEIRNGPDSRTSVVSAGGGCGLAKVALRCMEKGYAGLEFAGGIPGTVGGAVIMNAGAWGEEIAGILRTVTVLTAEGERILPRQGLDFGYRCWRDFSTFQGRAVVIGVDLELTADDPEQVRRRFVHLQEKRRANQPKGHGNAGSFFKNPKNDSAGRLIERSGLKGMQIGGARVSEHHANFLVNAGGATAADVLALMRLVQEKVREDSGIVLEPEVHFL
jgi:UDP-N-acetylmuramate dehydrogenase